MTRKILIVDDTLEADIQQQGINLDLDMLATTLGDDVKVEIVTTQDDSIEIMEALTSPLHTLLVDYNLIEPNGTHRKGNEVIDTLINTADESPKNVFLISKSGVPDHIKSDIEEKGFTYASTYELAVLIAEAHGNEAAMATNSGFAKTDDLRALLNNQFDTNLPLTTYIPADIERAEVGKIPFQQLMPLLNKDRIHEFFSKA